MKIGPFSFKSSGEIKHKAIFIGKGNFGSVYCVSDEETGKKYALKVMTQESMENPDKYSCYVSEAHMLTEVSYPTILHLYGYYEFQENETSNILLILTEYCKNKSLHDFFTQDKYDQLNTGKKIIIGYGVALGMQYLHNHNISHRDLKPENILLNDRFYPIISDFGFSRYSDTKVSSKDGTYLYSAPEINIEPNSFNSSDLSTFSKEYESSESSKSSKSSKSSESSKLSES